MIGYCPLYCLTVMCSVTFDSNVVLVTKACAVQGWWAMMEDECPSMLRDQACCVMTEDFSRSVDLRRGSGNEAG